MFEASLYSIHNYSTKSSLHLTSVAVATLTWQTGKRRAHTLPVTTVIIPRAGDSVITTQSVIVCPGQLVAAVTVLCSQETILYSALNKVLPLISSRLYQI